jgi:NAD(P)-dependent dehydrogenase (short-subunit alcohol dehydrogenase family)
MKGTALITGSAKRLGYDIAIKLASIGYKIALHCNTSINEAEDLAKKISKVSTCAIFCNNLSNENELLSLIPSVKKKFTDLNLLVNNASVFQKTSITETGIDVFNQNLNINFKAPFFLTRDFAINCKKGQIINMLDAKITHNDTSYASYTLSKKALADLTRISAKELAPNIRVNGIAPGYILAPENEDSNYLKKRSITIPLKRKGEPKEIANAIEFLIENDFITGQFIFVDGGAVLYPTL